MIERRPRDLIVAVGILALLGFGAPFVVGGTNALARTLGAFLALGTDPLLLVGALVIVAVSRRRVEVLAIGAVILGTALTVWIQTRPFQLAVADGFELSSAVHLSAVRSWAAFTVAALVACVTAPLRRRP